jgi:hypothetical protein
MVLELLSIDGATIGTATPIPLTFRMSLPRVSVLSPEGSGARGRWEKVVAALEAPSFLTSTGKQFAFAPGMSIGVAVWDLATIDNRKTLVSASLNIG